MGVIQGVAEPRNRLSDAHGRGPGDPDALPRLAHLAVNAAGTAALCLMQAFEARRAAVARSAEDPSWRPHGKYP